MVENLDVRMLYGLSVSSRNKFAVITLMAIVQYDEIARYCHDLLLTMDNIAALL